jgi:hypothetical protein
MSNTLKYNGKVVISNGTIGNVKEYDDNVSFNLIDKYSDYPTKIIFYNTEDIFIVLPPISDSNYGFSHGNEIMFTNLGTGNTIYLFLASKNGNWIINNIYTKSIHDNDLKIPDLTSPNEREVIIGDGENIIKRTLNINDLDNFSVVSPINGHILYWDGTNWINSTLAKVSEIQSALEDIQNVTLTSPISGQSLVYNGTNWVNQLLSYNLNDLNNMIIISPSNNDTLIWNGTNWINNSRYFPLTSLSDVDIVPSNGAVLQWNGTKWTGCYPELNKMADVEVSPSTNDLLIYNGTKWINSQNISVNELDVQSLIINSGSLDLSSKNIDITGATLNLDSANLTLSFNSVDTINVSNPVNGHILKWNGTNWVNSTHTHTLTGLTDANLNNIQYGEILFWNGTKWINHPLRIDEVKNISLSNPQSGQLLIFNGTNWTNQEYHCNISELNDVNITNLQNNQHLIWNGTSWVNMVSTHTLRDLIDTNIEEVSENQVLRWNGTIWTGFTLPNTFSTLDEINISNLTSGQYLSWNGTDWVNTSFNLGASDISLSLNELNDISFTGLTSGQVLGWNGTNWTNISSVGGLNNLIDVSILNPKVNDTLTYNGTNWENSSYSRGINGLSDVEITAPKNSHTLTYNSNSSKWINCPDFLINTNLNEYYVFYDEMDKSYKYDSRLSFVYKDGQRVDDEEGHYGIYKFYTSNTLSGFTDKYLATSDNANMIVIMTTIKLNFHPKCRFAIGSSFVPTYSSSKYKAYPLANEGQLTSATYNSENWFFWTESKSNGTFSPFYLSHIHNVNTSIDTRITPTNDTWYNFKFIINPNTNNIRAYINNQYCASITTTSFFTTFCITSVGSSTKNIYELFVDKYLYVHKRKQPLLSTGFTINESDFE